jgi:hypothetical protein
MYFQNSCLVSQERQPGSLETITLMFDGVPVEFNFRYCPPGKIAKNINGTDTEIGGITISNSITIDRFFMLENELSIKQFYAAMGQEAFQKHVDYINNEASRGPGAKKAYEPITTILEDQTSDKPITCVWLDDAVTIGTSLSQVAQEQLLRPTSIEALEFRLPGIYEWRYAALANSDATKKVGNYLFNRWPAIEEFSRTERVKYLEILSDIDSETWTRSKTGLSQMPSQNQFENLLQTLAQAPNPNALPFVLAVLNKVIYEDAVDLEASRGITASENSRLNGWNLANLHSNVTELVLTSSSTSALKNDWELLRDYVVDLQQIEDLEEIEELKNIKTALMGSFFNYQAQTKSFFERKQWYQYTVWGAMSWDWQTEKLKPDSADILGFESSVDDYNAGMRLVLRRAIRPDWFVMIRDSAGLGGNREGQIGEIFADHRDVVTRNALPEMKPIYDLAIETYEGLAHYENGDYVTAVQTIKTPAETDEGKLYNTLLKSLIAKDQSLLNN